MTHHRTLHDALQKDEVQVIGCGGAGAVAQCVQKTQHRWRAGDKKKQTTLNVNILLYRRYIAKANNSTDSNSSTFILVMKRVVKHLHL